MKRVTKAIAAVTLIAAAGAAQAWWNGPGYGNNGWGNNNNMFGDMFGDGAFDFSMSARGNGRGYGNGSGYGYNNPYYGYAPYGYAPYGYGAPAAGPDYFKAQQEAMQKHHEAMMKQMEAQRQAFEAK